jgi:hypothetical protein
MQPFILSGQFQIVLLCSPCLLDEPVQQHHPARKIDVKSTLAILFPERLVRTSNIPSPMGRQTGIPIGQPNSTV